MHALNDHDPTPMHDLIRQKLREIERSENVRILHAVESGSRAWGFPSRDSDYDVRFFYVRPLEDYLRLEKTRDVIELPINDILDINGWDLSKTLQLLHAANPTLFEWMQSDIVYLETDFAASFRPLLHRYFSSRKGLYHYISMADGNYKYYLKSDMVRAKKYFYVLRPVLACRWILERGTPPAMLFSELVTSQLEVDMRPIVEDLLDLKMSSTEVREIPKIQPLNDYLDRSIADIKERVQQLEATENPGWEPLNHFFRQMLTEPHS